jgi:hypothetical protein
LNRITLLIVNRTNPRGLLLASLLALDTVTWLHTALHGLNLLLPG